MLILSALSGNHSVIHNLSNANDTELMERLIRSDDHLIDVEDAGTTMRFLTAFFAITGQRKILTGTRRMKERPIGILVDGLRSLGATIQYNGREGYPPLTTAGFEGQKTNRLSIRGDVSSQFISALMMVAPLLPEGLTLELTGKISSRPYIEMTAALMEQFGVKSELKESSIRIDHQRYVPAELFVESDWSGASYWFAVAALASEADIRLPHLFEKSLQGDHVIQRIMKPLGVSAEMEEGMLRLNKTESQKELSWDFTHCPDLAQTVAIVCAAKGVVASFRGLESLRIKETDRIDALQKELNKIGAELLEKNGHWRLEPSTQIPAQAVFDTYEDHRMAMALAPLACVMDVTLDNPAVVRKSYPGFWTDMEALGFAIVR